VQRARERKKWRDGEGGRERERSGGGGVYRPSKHRHNQADLALNSQSPTGGAPCGHTLTQLFTNTPAAAVLSLSRLQLITFIQQAGKVALRSRYSAALRMLGLVDVKHHGKKFWGFWGRRFAWVRWLVFSRKPEQRGTSFTF